MHPEILKLGPQFPHVLCQGRSLVCYQDFTIGYGIYVLEGEVSWRGLNTWDSIGQLMAFITVLTA